LAQVVLLVLLVLVQTELTDQTLYLALLPLRAAVAVLMAEQLLVVVLAVAVGTQVP
jgi:hypothetical protein